jgi:hypothetical protein
MTLGIEIPARVKQAIGRDNEPIPMCSATASYRRDCLWKIKDAS